MTSALLVFLILLEIKHLLSDFVLQTHYQIQNKGTYGHPGGLIHAGVHGLGTALVLLLTGFDWWLIVVVAVVESLIHYHLDWFKENLLQHWSWAKNNLFWSMLGMDQLLHQLTYLGIAAILFM